ncbi:hypothetical protein F4782DRAFT_553070 [Xylaria castorea]|nr:hypothetical protein F4782DRAFT_553070 [Xylaria castorea]
MPYLIQSVEWRLLQELARLLEPKMARYRMHSEPLHDNKGVSSHAEQFEVELRQALTVEEFSDDLNQRDYDQCQANLRFLCSLLDNLTKWRSDHVGPAAPAYPRLSALVKYLALISKSVDLVNGPNETLFNLPRDDGELDNCLGVVSGCNFALGQLLQPAVEAPAFRPLRKTDKKWTWKQARIRNHAIFALGALFNHFRGGTSHEVLLKLTEDPGEDATLPSLQIMLSLCSELESWQEACCESVSLDPTFISSIPDICESLRREAGQGKALMLIIKEYALFGTWECSTSPRTDLSTKNSLHQLIVDGFFKPHNLQTLLNETPPTKFSTKEKRTLAVKLGFALMDFFDADVAPERIYLSGSSKSISGKEFPYLAFNSKLLGTKDSYNFGMGHPALLSFAKLLVELDIGESMNLPIHPHNSENTNAYAQLMGIVDRLETERIDSYVHAIRGCLVVHIEIARSLRYYGLVGKAADSKIRKKLYKEVVKKLELGLVESTPRLAHKRKRSISPSRSARWDGSQAAGYQTIDMRSVEPEQTSYRYWRRFTPRSQGTCEDVPGPSAARESLTLVPQPESSLLHLKSKAYEKLTTQYSTVIEDTSDNWFAELENMNAVVRIKSNERDVLAPRVKIAVLDSGVENQYSNDIVEYQDFVDESNSSCLDNTGHGTNVFRLLRKVCEDANIFTARVWDGSQHTPKTPALMEKPMSEAIDHAREMWRVDIIVLSSGFRATHNGIGEAIERANMAKILIFASPSNYGNMREVYYPGRLYGLGKVICLFSTNSMARSSTTKTFNPSPLDTAAHRTFAILGEDITLENTERPLNGTSYSTAIGAGIAARILDFSRHPQFRTRIKNIDDLKKVEGMLAVFGRMAKRTDSGYRCIAPWEICPPPEEGMERREARARQQSAVFDELKEALKNIHRA